MALQIRRGQTRSFGKMIAASFAVMALLIQPVYGVVEGEVANAIAPPPAPLTVATTCVDNKVVLALTTTQVELPELPNNAENWALGMVKYVTPYSTKTQNLSDNDVDTYSISTNQVSVDSGSVSAKVTAGYTTPKDIFFLGFKIGTMPEPHMYNQTISADYAALNCDAFAQSPSNTHITRGGKDFGIDAVTNTSAGTSSLGQLLLEWNPAVVASGVASYKIETTLPSGATVTSQVDGIVNNLNLKNTLDTNGAGWYKFKVTAVSNTGIEASTNEATLLYDKAAPQATINSPSQYVNTTKPFTISGTYKDESSANAPQSGIGRFFIYISVNGQEKMFTVPTDQFGMSGTYSYALTQVQLDQLVSQLKLKNNDSFTIKVNIFDKTNNSSSTTKDFTADNTAPSKPVIKTPTPRQWFKTTPIANSWDAATDASGIAKYQVAYHYDDNHSFGNSTCAGESINGVLLSGCRDVLAGTSRLHTPTANEQGGVTVWVRAIDNAGNVGPWSSSVHYYYDAKDPTTTMSVPTGFVNNSFTITGEAEDNVALNRVYLQLNKSTGGRFGGITVNMITNPLSKTNSWTHTYNAHTLGLVDGKYRAHASVTDMIGNSSDTGWSEYFTIDTIKPIVAITSTADGVVDGINSYKVSQYVTVNVDELNLGTTKVYKADGTEVQSHTSSNFTLTSGLPEGEYYLVHTDQANNSSEKQSFVISRTAPVLENLVVRSVYSGTSSTDQNLNFGVNENGGSDIKNVRIAINTYDATKSNNRGAQVYNDYNYTANADGTYTLDLKPIINSKNLQDGQKYVLLVQAGNTAGVHDTEYFTFTVDNSAPDLSITGASLNAQGTYTINGTTDDPTSPIGVTVDGTLLTGLTLNGNNWSVNTGVLLDGAHTVVVTSVDAVGNDTTETYSFKTEAGNATIDNLNDADTPDDSALNGGNNAGGTGDDAGEVEGASTTKQGTVEGASTTKNADNAAKASGMASWFWWILAAAAASFVWWLIAAARKRKSEE